MHKVSSDVPKNDNQLVSAQMRLSIHENLVRCSVRDEGLEDGPHVGAVLAWNGKIHRKNEIRRESEFTHIKVNLKNDIPIEVVSLPSLHVPAPPSP